MGIFSLENGKVNTKKWEPYVTYRDGKKSNDESILQELIFDHPDLFPVNQIADNTDHESRPSFSLFFLPAMNAYFL